MCVLCFFFLLMSTYSGTPHAEGSMKLNRDALERAWASQDHEDKVVRELRQLESEEIA